MRIFLSLFFLSCNLNAANYLICESDNQSLNIKLDNKKIFIQYYTEDFRNYSSYIKKWTDELIITERQFNYIDNKRSNCFWNNADLEYILHFEPSSKLKEICKNVEDVNRNKEGVEIININRLNGLLLFDKGKLMYDFNNPGNWIQKTNFKCKIQEKTLF